MPPTVQPCRPSPPLWSLDAKGGQHWSFGVSNFDFSGLFHPLSLQQDPHRVELKTGTETLEDSASVAVTLWGSLVPPAARALWMLPQTSQEPVPGRGALCLGPLETSIPMSCWELGWGRGTDSPQKQLLSSLLSLT